MRWAGENCSCCTFSCDHLGALSVLEMYCKSQILIQHHSHVEHKPYSLSSILHYILHKQQWWLLFIDTLLLADNQPDSLVPSKCFQRAFSDKGFNIPQRFSTNREKYTDHIFEKVILHFKSGLFPNCKATTNCIESCLEGILLIIIHYSFQKNMAKMEINIKLRKQHKVKRIPSFSSSQTFFPFTSYFIYTKYKRKQNCIPMFWDSLSSLEKKKVLDIISLPKFPQINP